MSELWHNSSRSFRCRVHCHFQALGFHLLMECGLQLQQTSLLAPNGPCLPQKLGRGALSKLVCEEHIYLRYIISGTPGILLIIWRAASSF
jgi:hypothetical protein